MVNGNPLSPKKSVQVFREVDGKLVRKREMHGARFAMRIDDGKLIVEFPCALEKLVLSPEQLLQWSGEFEKWGRYLLDVRAGRAS